MKNITMSLLDAEAEDAETDEDNDDVIGDYAMIDGQNNVISNSKSKHHKFKPHSVAARRKYNQNQRDEKRKQLEEERDTQKEKRDEKRKKQQILGNVAQDF